MKNSSFTLEKIEPLLANGCQVKTYLISNNCPVVSLNVFGIDIQWLLSELDSKGYSVSWCELDCSDLEELEQMLMAGKHVFDVNSIEKQARLFLQMQSEKLVVLLFD